MEIDTERLAKLFGMQSGSWEENAKVGHRLYDHLAGYNDLERANKELGKEIDELKEKLINLEMAEQAIAELLSGKDLSGITKAKNKGVADKLGISIDYVKKCLVYPEAKTDQTLSIS